jgi:hypothetical protein
MLSVVFEISSKMDAVVYNGLRIPQGGRNVLCRARVSYRELNSLRTQDLSEFVRFNSDCMQVPTGKPLFHVHVRCYA